MKELEQRFLRAELRSIGDEEDGEDFALDGYAATFESESTDPGLGFKEILTRGCFARSIQERDDVRALKNHDPNFVLGRTKNGTLRLAEDARGLKFRVQLDRGNPDHVSTFRAVKRGDMDACSFGFIAREQSWADMRDADGNLYAQRRLHDVALMDVSAVTYPAYGETTVAARSRLFPQGCPLEIRSRIPILGSHGKDELLTRILKQYL